MGTVTDLDSYRPHSVAQITCEDCGYEWTAVYPSSVKAMECPGCHNAVNEHGERVPNPEGW